MITLYAPQINKRLQVLERELENPTLSDQRRLALNLEIREDSRAIGDTRRLDEAQREIDRLSESYKHAKRL